MSEWEQERRIRLGGLNASDIDVKIVLASGETLSVMLAAPDQAGNVHRVARAAFAEHEGFFNPPSGSLKETVEDVAAAIADGGALLGMVRQQPVGGLRFRLMPDHLYVGRVGVVPEYRARGIASHLMRRAERVATSLGATEIRLGTRAKLERNLRFYQKLGYDQIDLRPHALGGPDLIAIFRKVVR